MFKNSDSSVAASLSAVSATRKIAYVMSRFPSVSETFILNEMIALGQAGLSIYIFPLIRNRAPVYHPEVETLVSRTCYAQVLSLEVLSAQLFWLWRKPRSYLQAWVRALRGNLGSPGFLLRALVVVPEAMFFARRMRELGITHIHAHFATHPALAAYIIHQITNIPYSITTHAHDIYVDRAMLREKIEQAVFVVAISEYNRRLLIDLYGASVQAKLYVIHCGIDLDLFKPRPARTAADIFTIVCVASLQDYKGHPYLIQACAELRAQGISFRCLLVGEGEDRHKLETMIQQLGLTEITLLGALPRHQVSALLAEADVMVLPSITTASGKKEGIPVALMEAMATELPVIATAISGIPELVENNVTGLLVPERDASALAQAMLLLYHNPALAKQLGTAARAKIAQEFDIRQTIPQLYALLNQDWASSG